MEIFGTDYHTPDGTPVRDYVHVCDLASAHVSALDYLLAGGQSAGVNLRTGRGHSIREVISVVEAVGGTTVPVLEGPRRTGDPPALVADPQLAEKFLGWTARNSDLQTIVRTAWQWYQKPRVKSARSDSREHGLTIGMSVSNDVRTSRSRYRWSRIYRLPFVRTITRAR